MSETYYRIHWADCPAFSPENAWSALWGATRSPDGSQTECTVCAGVGKSSSPCPTCDGRGYRDGDPDHECGTCDGTGDVDECTACDGTGWQDALQGYSCCDTAEELVRYFTHAARDAAEDDDKVVVFEGTRVGDGFDGEPLAVPTRIIEEVPWSEFRTRTI